MTNCMVTTIDNPWNPFTQYNEWLNYDEHVGGYMTNRWLGLLARTAVDLDISDNDKEIDDAQNRLLDINPFGLHVKLYEDEAKDLIPIYNKVYRESVSNDIPKQ